MTAVLEIIHLRSVDRSPAEIQRAISASLVTNDGSEPEVRLFRHLRVAGDVTVHLRHKSTERVARQSHLGLHLAEALKAYGLVEHSVWVEVDDGKSSRLDGLPPQEGGS